MLDEDFELARVRFELRGAVIPRPVLLARQGLYIGNRASGSRASAL